MATPSREDALATLAEGQGRLDELVSSIPPDDLARSATIGGGDWSVQDLIGHIATWEELAVRSLVEWQAGEVPWVESPDGPFSDPTPGNVDEFNAGTIEEHRAASTEQTLARAADVHRRLVEAIEGLTDEQWRARAGYDAPDGRRRTLVTLLGSVLGAPRRPFGHAFAHLPDLDALARSLG